MAAPGADPGPLAGWESVIAEVSRPGTGLRVVQVTLDTDGRPLAASDLVHVRHADGRLAQESVGGRFEPDGAFHGTHWLSHGIEREDDEDVAWQLTPREPTAAEAAALRALVTDVLRRASA